MPLIRIGTNRNGTPVYFPETLSHNVIICLARQRYGKSVLAANLYTQIAEFRNVVIFDYNGDHRLSRWGNWRNKNHNLSFISDLYTVEDFAFYISDFDNFSDWISMDFTDKAVHVIMELLSYPEIHQNNPVEFIKLLNEVPFRDDMIEPFNEKYGGFGLTRDVRMHEGVHTNMVNTMMGIWRTGLLMPPMDTQDYEVHTPGKRNIDDWADLIMQHKHVHINLKVNPAENIGIVRAAVGKIMDKIHPVLHIVKPLIVAEEGDYLAPQVDEMETITSLMQLSKLVNKDQRTGVALLIITQQPAFLHTSILSGGTVWIMGPHTPSFGSINALDDQNFSYANEILSELQYELNKGSQSYREFAILQPGSGSDGNFQIFAPDDALNVLPWELYKRKRVNPRAAVKARKYELIL